MRLVLAGRYSMQGTIRPKPSEDCLHHLERLCAVLGSLAPVKTLNLVNIGCFRHSPAVLFAGVFVLAAGEILSGPASRSIEGPGVPHHWPAGRTSPVAPTTPSGEAVRTGVLWLHGTWSSQQRWSSGPGRRGDESLKREAGHVLIFISMPVAATVLRWFLFFRQCCASAQKH